MPPRSRAKAEQTNSVAAALPTPLKESSPSSPPDDCVQWSLRGGIYFPTGATVPNIPPAVYEVVSTQMGPGLRPLQFPSDELLRLPDTPIDFILQQIQTFLNSEQRFKDVGFIHKRGILMYGGAGTGKTSLIRLLCNDLIRRGGIVLFVERISLAESILKSIRAIDPERPIMNIFEDIEGFMGDGYESSESRSLLSLLDGETQIEHVINIATTNRPGDLEERIIKRPGRFDVVIGVKYPTEQAREVYLRRILKYHMSEQEFRRVVKATHGLGLAHLRELVSSVYCLQLDLDETLERLRANVRKTPKVSRNPDEEHMGFTVNYFDDKALKEKAGPGSNLPSSDHDSEWDGIGSDE